MGKNSANLLFTFQSILAPNRLKQCLSFIVLEQKYNILLEHKSFIVLEQKSYIVSEQKQQMSSEEHSRTGIEALAVYKREEIQQKERRWAQRR